MSSYIQALIDSVIPSTPSKNTPILPDQKVLKMMDLSFFLLILTLIGLFLITNFNLHVFGLIIVSCCLWISIRWFVAELGRMNNLNRPLNIKVDEDNSKDQLSSTDKDNSTDVKLKSN